MTTIRNPNLSPTIGTDFTPRNDLLMRWGLTLSTYQYLPGLVTLWPMNRSSPGLNEQVYDIGIHGIHFTDTGDGGGSGHFGIDGVIPYRHLPGVSCHLEAGDSGYLNIVGTENLVDVSVRGLTVGTWIYPIEERNCMVFARNGSGATVVDPQYGIYMNDDGTIDFSVRNAGDTTNTTVSGTYTVNQWNLVIARYQPAVELSIFVNGTQTANTTSIPSSLLSASTNFVIMGWDYVDVDYFYGNLGITFVSKMALTNTIINGIFQQSRIPFGVTS